MSLTNASRGEGRGTLAKRRRRLARLTGAVTLLVGSSAWAQGEPAPAEPAAPETAAAEPAPLEPAAAEAAAPVAPSGPHTANSLQLGVGFRYGVMLSDGDLNPWATGLGLDVGYTLPNAIYLGGSFEYFFGESKDALGLKVSANIWQLSAEGGYDIGLGENFVIRPKVGFGVAGLNSKVEGCPADVSCEGSSTTKAAIAPGATFLLFTSKFSFAVDARYDIVLTDPALKGLIFSFGIGF